MPKEAGFCPWPGANITHIRLKRARCSRRALRKWQRSYTLISDRVCVHALMGMSCCAGVMRKCTSAATRTVAALAQAAVGDVCATPLGRTRATRCSSTATTMTPPIKKIRKIGDGEIGDQGTRIISTVMQGREQYLTSLTGNLAEARSYIFSLGSNQELNTHSATLVLYYDSDARKSNGDLLIYRWREDNGAHWQRLTTVRA